MKAPFPWFGGKTRIASIVWAAFGDPANYVEPFCGSMAMLLARPGWDVERGCWADNQRRIETANDINAWLTNAYRGIKTDPDQVAYYASDLVSEIDLHARGDWLFYRPNVDQEFVERLRSDPEYCDAKSAGWWVWGQSSWIGDNWGRAAHNACKDENGNAIGVVHARPHLGDAGGGVNRKLPHLGDSGRGVNRKRPHLSDGGMGVNHQLSQPAWAPSSDPTDTPRRQRIAVYLQQLAARLADVRICCGDWRRVLGFSPTTKLGLTAVFMDPPYAVSDRDNVYGEHEDKNIAHDVRAWCLEHGDDPMFRIALCGYDEHDMSETWREVAWKAQGGYSNQRHNQDAVNRYRERVYFSPHCLNDNQSEQFELSWQMREV